MGSDHSRWALALLVLSTLIVRVGIIAKDWGSFKQDEDSYARLAVNWRTTGTFGFPELKSPATTTNADASSDTQGNSDASVEASSPIAKMRPTAYRPPMYPLLLTALVYQGEVNPYALATLHVLLGLLTTVATFFIAVRLQFRWPIIPALAVAVDPLLLRASQLVMTETFITFLFVVVWLMALKLFRPSMLEMATRRRFMSWSIRSAALIGLFLGMAIMTRPTMLPWAVLVMLMLIARRNESGSRVTILSIASSSSWPSFSRG